MAIHSHILTWRIPWTEEPGEIQSMWSRKIGHDWSNLACVIDYIIGHCQSNQPPAHHPLPEIRLGLKVPNPPITQLVRQVTRVNPMDRRTWWDTVHAVTKDQTWLKQLSMRDSLHHWSLPITRWKLNFWWWVYCSVYRSRSIILFTWSLYVINQLPQ